MKPDLYAAADLQGLVEAYEATSHEAAAVAATLHLLEEGSVSLSADHFIPGHVTASGFVVDSTRTRVLLIHHAKLRKWLQPGGHVDPGEDVLTAAIREVTEETGVVGRPLELGIFDMDVHPISPSGGRPAHTHYDIRFLFGATNEDFADSDEVLGVRWVLFAAVPSLTEDASVLRPIAKLQRLFSPEAPTAD